MTKIASVVVKAIKGVGVFFAGFFVSGAIKDKQQLNNIKKTRRGYEKIDTELDARADIDVLRKHKR